MPRNRKAAAPAIATVLAALGVFAACVLAPTHRAAARMDTALPGLAWMTGCWQTGGGETREVWTRGTDDIYFGFNVVERNGALAFFEQLRLEKRAGGWVYVASPRGGTGVPFALTEHEDTAAAFTNPSHDFPQKIAYRRDGDTLTARASLSSGEDAREWHFSPCKE